MMGYLLIKKTIDYCADKGNLCWELTKNLGNNGANLLAHVIPAINVSSGPQVEGKFML